MAKYRSIHRKRTDFVKLFSTLVAGAATVSYFANSITDTQRANRQAQLAILENKKAIDEVVRQRVLTEAATLNIQELLNQLSKVQKNVPSDSASREELISIKQQVAIIQSDATNLHSRLDGLSDMMVNNPEKAVSIPLLKKDLDDLRVSTQQDLESIHGEMTRSYDIMKWLIGLILAAMFATVINTSIQSRGKKLELEPWSSD